MIDQDELIQFIEQLLMTHSPSGYESEMDDLLLPRFEALADEVRQDNAGNIIGVMRGETSDEPVGFVTHKDELGMIVKRVQPDGKLRLETTSSAQPWIYGEGPVDVLGDEETATGVLSFGARHVSAESVGAHAGKDGRQPAWPNVWVTTGLTASELERKGVHIGSPAVIGRARKTPLRFGGCLGGYGLDCKASLGIMLAAMGALKGKRLKRDVYFVATANEEVGVFGGLYVSRALCLEHAIAIEVGPVAAEYETRNCEAPILLYKDASIVYDDRGNRALSAAATDLGVPIQRAVITSFGSDASFPVKYGMVARSNCICFPTENTHGYELAPISAIYNTARVLARFMEMEYVQ